MKFFVRALLISNSILFSLGCAHTSESQKSNVAIGSKMDEKSYVALIAKNTRHDIQYEGFYNKFEVSAMFFNSEVQTAILQKKSDVLQWDQKQAQTEREKLFQENSNQTRFEISFFTPSGRLNDLHKGNSIWKIYLEAGGQRYEGHAMKNNGKLEDLREIYPHHNRWSTAYDVTFNVPLSLVEKSKSENGKVELVITSTQGTSRLSY
jgi:hypothetical protein